MVRSKDENNNIKVVYKESDVTVARFSATEVHVPFSIFIIVD